MSKEVAILGVSPFVLGFGRGHLVAGPMSEIDGRKVVYRLSLVTILPMFKRINLDSRISDNNTILTAPPKARGHQSVPTFL